MMTQRNDLYPVLYSCNIPVKGANRAILCDVQRQEYQLIPHSLYEILTSYEGKTLSSIKADFNNEYDDIIDEYFDDLTKDEWVFFTDTPQYFPKMDLTWDEPSVITNAIIDITGNSTLHFDSIFEQLSQLGCEHIQIRCFFDRPLSYFQSIVDAIGTKRIVSISIVLKYQNIWSDELLIDFCDKNPRIASLNIYKAPENRVLSEPSYGMGHIYLNTNNITNASHCGQINSDLFVVNLKTFSEAKQYNSCLNRKISIDTEGYIRNCPSMKNHYGHIENTTLLTALNHPDFDSYWHISKDKITTCKDCEFRYICTDCRAFLENPEDEYSKPLRCGYNPYTSEWQKWSVNSLKDKAIQHDDLVI
jgi:SPASM domain peptide maturase of grasp-with-spasm system